MSSCGGQRVRGVRGERGAAAVEFAIVLPVLVLFLFGIVDFGIAMYDKTIVTTASRQAARFGTVYAADADRQTCDTIYSATIQSFEQQLVSFASSGSTTISRNCFRCTNAGCDPTPLTGTTAVCTQAAKDAGYVRLAVETSFNYTYLAIPRVRGIVSDAPPFALTVRLGSTTQMNCE